MASQLDELSAIALEGKRIWRVLKLFASFPMGKYEVIYVHHAYSSILT